MKRGIGGFSIDVGGGSGGHPVPGRLPVEEDDYSGKLGRAQHDSAALLRRAEQAGRRLDAGRRRAAKSGKGGGGAASGSGGRLPSGPPATTGGGGALDPRVAGLSYGLGRVPTAVTRTVFRLNGPSGGVPSRRGQPLAEHVDYLARPEAQVRQGGAGVEVRDEAIGGIPAGAGAAAADVFFDAAGDGVDADDLPRRWRGDRHHWRVIVSPERVGDPDLRALARGFARRLEGRLRTPLEWAGACHFNTATPHVHLLIRGRRGDGRDLLMTRDFIAEDLRLEAGAELLSLVGPRSEAVADAAILKMAARPWMTPLDDLIAGIEARSGGGAFRLPDAWLPELAGRHHLLARLRALEALGLAARTPDRPTGWGDAAKWSLVPDWRAHLERMTAPVPPRSAVSSGASAVPSAVPSAGAATPAAGRRSEVKTGTELSARREVERGGSER